MIKNIQLYEDFLYKNESIKFSYNINNNKVEIIYLNVLNKPSFLKFNYEYNDNMYIITNLIYGEEIQYIKSDLKYIFLFISDILFNKDYCLLQFEKEIYDLIIFNNIFKKYNFNTELLENNIIKLNNKQNILSYSYVIDKLKNCKVDDIIIENWHHQNFTYICKLEDKNFDENRILNLCESTGFYADYEVKFNIINRHIIKQVDDINPIFRGFGWGYKCYLRLIKELDYIDSPLDRRKTIFSQGLWNKLFKDSSIYTIDKGQIGIAINKKLSDDKIIEILKKINFDISYKHNIPQKIINKI